MRIRCPKYGRRSSSRSTISLERSRRSQAAPSTAEGTATATAQGKTRWATSASRSSISVAVGSWASRPSKKLSKAGMTLTTSTPTRPVIKVKSAIG